MVTLPSPSTASHESIWLASISGGPIFGSWSAPNAVLGLSRRGSAALTTSAPVPATNCRRLRVALMSRLRFGCGLDRRDDPEVRPAAAQPRVHRPFDLLLARPRVLLQEGVGGHDHAVRAVAAL